MDFVTRILVKILPGGLIINDLYFDRLPDELMKQILISITNKDDLNNILNVISYKRKDYPKSIKLQDNNHEERLFWKSLCCLKFIDKSWSDRDIKFLNSGTTPEYFYKAYIGGDRNIIYLIFYVKSNFPYIFEHLVNLFIVYNIRPKIIGRLIWEFVDIVKHMLKMSKLELARKEMDDMILLNCIKGIPLPMNYNFNLCFFNGENRYSYLLGGPGHLITSYLLTQHEKLSPMGYLNLGKEISHLIKSEGLEEYNYNEETYLNIKIPKRKLEKILKFIIDSKDEIISFQGTPVFISEKEFLLQYLKKYYEHSDRDFLYELAINLNLYKSGYYNLYTIKLLIEHVLSNIKE